MEYIAQSRLLKDFFTILDGSTTPKHTVFACRPRIAITAERDTVISKFTGKIGLEELEDFKLALGDLVTDRLHKLIVDFSEVKLSRTAIGTFANFAAGMYGRNKKLYLFQPSPQLRVALDDLGLTSFFNVLEAHEDILITIFI